MTGPDSGPVRLGLLMQRYGSRERPFGALTPFVQTVTRLAGREGVAVSAFDPEDVDRRRRLVAAWRWEEDASSWRVEWQRLPDVVWNRYYGRDATHLLAALQRLGISLLNEGGLNKWDAYQCLRKDPVLAPHLPQTRLLSSAADALALLDEFPVAFLKPVAGSVGRGIIRTSRENGNILRLEYMSARTGRLREVFASPYQLDRWIERRRGAAYIAQQGLNLAIFHGRPADVRVLVQKDSAGRWQVTGMGARVAAHGRFTANLHTGGQGVPVEMLAEALFSRADGRRRQLLDDLQGLALNAANAIERQVGALGELGLDFGVEAGGHIWYIEQNGQPGRAIFEHLGRRDLTDLAHLRPVQYARHLCTIKSAKAAGHPST
jgi:hypothetical protein